MCISCIGSSQLIPLSFAGDTVNGHMLPLSFAVMEAPIRLRKSTVFPTGFFMDSSLRITVDVNGCPLRTPRSSLIAVPDRPALSGDVGAFSPYRPLPWTLTLLSFRISIPTCIRLKQSMVLRQSSPSRKLSISVVPLARAPITIALWDMDLSPGTVISPLSLFLFSTNTLFPS